MRSSERSARNVGNQANTRSNRRWWPVPSLEGGEVVKNKEGKPPQESDGYYKEHTVETPGCSNRRARRIVKGGNGESYYTDDHYQTSTRIDPEGR
ncbi:MAG: ribonuclease domain-containing protein [Acidobacteriota bacterium]